MTGEVTHIRENGAASGIGVLATFAYDQLGRRTSRTLGNGLATTYAYDPVSRLDELRLDFAGTADDLVSEFAYNPASQIASNTRSNDAYSWTSHGSGTTSTSADGLNRIASWVSTLAYDSRGNITTDGSYTYTYSSENLLTSLANSASGAIQAFSTYAYDPLMRLAAIDSSNDALDASLGYDGADFVLEGLSGNRTRRYVRGPGVDEPLVAYLVTPTGTSRLWYQADERGSIVRLSNDAGTPGGIGKYDEYGVGGTGRIRYAGQYWLADGSLHYSRARIYDARLGRFLQPDPIGYGDGMNMYAYVGGDPINSTDPSGTAEYESNRPYPIDNDDEWKPLRGYSLAELAGGHSRDGMGMWDIVFVVSGRVDVLSYERAVADLPEAARKLNRISKQTGISEDCLLSSSCTSGAVYLANSGSASRLPGTSISSGGRDSEGYITVGLGNISYNLVNPTNEIDIGFNRSSVKVTTYTSSFAQPNQPPGFPIPFGSFLIDLSACSGCRVQRTVAVPVTLGVNRTYTFNISPMVSVLGIRPTSNTPRNTYYRIRIR